MSQTTRSSKLVPVEASSEGLTLHPVAVTSSRPESKAGSPSGSSRTIRTRSPHRGPETVNGVDEVTLLGNETEAGLMSIFEAVVVVDSASVVVVDWAVTSGGLAVVDGVCSDVVVVSFSDSVLVVVSLIVIAVEVLDWSTGLGALKSCDVVVSWLGAEAVLDEQAAASVAIVRSIAGNKRTCLMGTILPWMWRDVSAV